MSAPLKGPFRKGFKCSSQPQYWLLLSPCSRRLLLHAKNKEFQSGSVKITMDKGGPDTVDKVNPLLTKLSGSFVSLSPQPQRPQCLSPGSLFLCRAVCVCADFLRGCNPDSRTAQTFLTYAFAVWPVFLLRISFLRKAFIFSFIGEG